LSLFIKGSGKKNQGGLYEGAESEIDPLDIFNGFPRPVSLWSGSEIRKGLFSDPSLIPYALNIVLDLMSMNENNQNKCLDEK
jgi:hypothetical protein